MKSPVHIGKVIKTVEALIAKGTPKNPVNIHEQNEAFRFMIGEWQGTDPRGPLKAFIKWQKAQGLI